MKQGLTQKSPRNSPSQEAELRKRIQNRNIHRNAKGIVENTTYRNTYPFAHQTCFQRTCTAIAASQAVNAIVPTTGFTPAIEHSNISERTIRRFSESAADELLRNGEIVKCARWTYKMWQNELCVNPNSTITQPMQQRSNCCQHFAEDDGRACCCFEGGNIKNRISDAVDIGIRVTLILIFISLETTRPFKRKIHPEEMWLYKNPRTPDIVSAQTLLLSVIFGPLCVTMIHLWLTGDRRDFRAASWVWTLALGLNGITTSLLKITVGRHRPDFFYRCFPNGIEVLSNDTNAYGVLDFYNCTGNMREIGEGRKSFPSGHASFAFVGCGFIAIYIGAKLHALSARGRGQSWRLCITFMPIILAALVAISRTCDYHHHWEDVVAGGFIGVTITYLVYRQYYPSLVSTNCHRPYLRACRRIGGTADMRNLNYSPKSKLDKRSSIQSDIKDGNVSGDNSAGLFKNFAYGTEYGDPARDECYPLLYEG